MLVALWLAGYAYEAPAPAVAAAMPSVNPTIATASPFVLRGTGERPNVAYKAAVTAPTKTTDGAIEVSDHCSITYIGSTTEQAFEAVSPAVRGKVLDCISYYGAYHRYPTAEQLKALTAAQDRDYVRHLSPQERRLQNEYAIGEAVCHGDEACVERGVEANQAIDKLEDQLNANNRN